MDASRKPGDLKPIKDILKSPTVTSMLSQNGKPTNEGPISPASENSPLCPICNDVGFIYAQKPGGKPDYSKAERCVCKDAEDRRRRDENLLKMCELPKYTQLMTMETFIVREGNQRAVVVAKEIIAGELRWLTMTGPPGTGKSHLAMAICKKWLEEKRPARYANVPRLLDELRAGMEDHSTDYRFNVYCTVPLLILDDLGAEHPTSWVTERLTTILNERLLNGLPLVVTTNCALADLPGDNMHRIADRLKREEFCRVVEMRP
jgi:DNA replication protein DnaC